MQEKNQSECLKTLQEKEQQESLALEELELQKKAIQSECDKKVEKMHEEIESCRTVSKDSNRVNVYIAFSMYVSMTGLQMQWIYCDWVLLILQGFL